MLASFFRDDNVDDKDNAAATDGDDFFFIIPLHWEFLPQKVQSNRFLLGKLAETESRYPVH